MPGAIDEAIVALTGPRLLQFLSRQRWFGAKGEVPTSAVVADWMCIRGSDASLAAARIRVDTSRGRALYQLPIAVRETLPPGVPESAVLATIAPRHPDASEADRGPALVSRDCSLYVYDAAYDPQFRAMLARGIATGIEAVAGSGRRWVVEGAAEMMEQPDRSRATRLLGVEQSNTCIVIDDAVIVKLFRRLVVGVHPEVEVTRFLTTRAGFTHTPAFLGALRFEDEYGTTIAGMTQHYVPGATDLWAYTLERGRAYFAAPEDRDAPNELLADAKRLGETTRAMHVALASRTDDPAFAPEPVSPDDVERWAARAQQSVRDALALLERQLDAPGFPREREAEARALARRREHFAGWINEIVDSLGSDLGLQVRIHGDFHLGQVLRAPDGELLIIDFEGEPTRPLDERRERASPLRDVAGMLRSFAYAAATLAVEQGARLKPQIRELRAARWERDTRQAFLDGYLTSSAGSPNPLPAHAADTRRLIELFETEKAFYELSYELNNRPTWAWIPMRGISKLFVR
jgi:maltose alpha-D-glucosyltransferase/alpha-amylase